MEQKKNLIFLHGPAISASRAHLLRLKASFNPDNILVLDKGSINDLFLAVANNSLFTEDRLVVVEIPGEDLVLDEIVIPEGVSLVLWSDHEVAQTKPLMKSLRALKGQVVSYSEEKETSIFPFLDLLASRSNKAYSQLKKIKQAGFDLQYILVMVLYLLRKELKLTQPHFTKDEITKYYKQVLEIDFKFKSGLLTSDQAEFELIRIFTS